MGINYDALRSGASAVQVPVDGKHQARLARAALVQTKSGERLVTEWSDDIANVEWSSWNRFDQTGIEYTRELLVALGIDLSTVTNDEALENELAGAADKTYDVRTQSTQGSQGDRWFTNTYVDGRAQGIQGSLSGPNGTQADVPIDSSDLSDTAAQAVEDDKIPF